MTCVDTSEHGVNEGLDYLSAELGSDQRPNCPVAKFSSEIMTRSHHVETCSEQSSKRQDP
jgi:hypothetical protein